MKILLISINTCTEPFPVYPLGMSVVANILTKNGNIVHQFDFFANNQSYTKVEECILDFDPEIIGISLRNYIENSIEITNNIIKISKKFNKLVFVGGSACSSDSKSIFKETKADFYFIGPAESNIVPFINNLKKGKTTKKKIFKMKKYDNLYGPLYDKDILKFYLPFNESIGLNTKRGCMNNCFYCNYQHIDGHYIKYRNVNDIINDILFLKKNKVKSIFFADSILNDNLQFLEELLTKMEKEKINIKWTGFLRPGNISKELLLLMKKTGLETVNIGIDGTTNKTLKGYRKNFTWQDVIEIDKMVFEQNFDYTRSSFLFGGPFETKETVLEGIDNIKKLHFKVMNVDVFDQCIKDGKKIKQQEICNVDREWIKEQLVNAFGSLGDITLEQKK